MDAGHNFTYPYYSVEFGYTIRHIAAGFSALLSSRPVLPAHLLVAPYIPYAGASFPLVRPCLFVVGAFTPFAVAWLLLVRSPPFAVRALSHCAATSLLLVQSLASPGPASSLRCRDVRYPLGGWLGIADWPFDIYTPYLHHLPCHLGHLTGHHSVDSGHTPRISLL